MTLHEEAEILGSLPLFSEIEPAKLKLLAFASDRLNFPAGGVLFREGARGDAAYVILEGSVEIFAGADGKGLKIAEAGKSDIVGEIAILRDVPRTATVIAKTEVAALAINKDVFLSLLDEFPHLALGVMRDLARRLEETTRKLRQAEAARRKS